MKVPHWFVQFLADRIEQALLQRLEGRERELLMTYAWCGHVLHSGEMLDVDYWLPVMLALLEETDLRA